MEFNHSKTSFFNSMTEEKSKQKIMEERLRGALNISFLQIENQSALHSGHMGDDGSGESHYKIKLDSSDLQSLSRLAKHRKVLEILGDDITGHTHSISLNIK